MVLRALLVVAALGSLAADAHMLRRREAAGQRILGIRRRAAVHELVDRDAQALRTHGGSNMGLAQRVLC